MQVKTMDGTMHEVAASQIERVAKMLPKTHHQHPTKMTQLELDEVLVGMADKACKYKEKAEHNIKRIAQLQSLPTTEEDMKCALAEVLCHGCPSRKADLIYQVIEFEVARFMKHLMAEYME